MLSVVLGFGLGTRFICDIIEQFDIEGFIVLLCKSSNASGQEKKLSPYKLCPVFSVPTVSPAAVALVAVMEALTCFLYLPNYTVIFYMCSVQLQSL
jgi:hypothetical protein